MSDIQIVFIRHGQRQMAGDDKLAQLTESGSKEVQQLATHLSSLGVTPVVYFTSAYKHAKETACILASAKSATTVEVEALTPRTDESLFTIENILGKATEHKIDLDSGGTVALVGHENRLSQLITRITGTRIRPLDLLDVVCVVGKTRQHLQLGCGQVLWRIPVRAYQEQELRPKVASKMTVATFLAGFTFTALLQILTTAQMPTLQQLDIHQTLSAWLKSALPLLSTICLTAATAFFVASVYIYDRLSMPEGFWATARAPKWRNLPRTVQKHKNEHGLIYGHMIHTWTWVFGPGVLLATVGFLIIVIEHSSVELSALFGMVMVVIGGYYLKVRPQLGVD